MEYRTVGYLGTGGACLAKAIFGKEMAVVPWTPEKEMSCLVVTPTEELTVQDAAAIASFVVNGGAMIVDGRAVCRFGRPELEHILGASVLHEMPFGEIKLTAAGSKPCRIYAEPVLLREHLFATLQPLVEFRYGAAQIPAVWQRPWGKGRVLVSMLALQLFCESPAASMLQGVVKQWQVGTRIDTGWDRQ